MSLQLESALRTAHTELQRCHEELEFLRSERSRLQANEKLAAHRALHDEVTRLPNRSYFRERLDAALTSAAELAVFYMDLDAFKLLNDSYGHHVGDNVLAIVGRRMTEALREDDLVSRFHGDEFACLLLGVPTFDHLAQMARKLLKATARPVEFDAVKFNVGISIGIAKFPADGLTTDALLQSADKAMYQAKRQKTGYAFYNSLSEQSRSRERYSSHLKR